MPEVLDGDVVLRAGAAQAVLRPQAGGRVCRLALVAGKGSAVDVLFPYDAPHVDSVRWAKGGIYPLVPYSNRIAQARLSTPSGEVLLAPHPDAQPHTLHGNAHGLPWRCSEQSATSATLLLDSPACAAWPWHYRATQHIGLQASALSLRLEIVNAGDRPMPAGLGWHPYLRHEPQAHLGFVATTWWSRTPDFLATAHRPLRQEEGFNPPRSLPPGTLTDYLSGWRGPLDVDLPGGATLRLRADDAVSHLVLHRPPDGRYLCVEPVTHVADGFNLEARGVVGTGTRWLDPGQSFAVSMHLELVPPTRKSSP
jgi:aldose 1-epimerase